MSQCLADDVSAGPLCILCDGAGVHDEQVNYITGRLVQEFSRSSNGNPVYWTEAYPLFYWWNHTMYNDPEQDGVNGNERVYQENVRPG